MDVVLLARLQFAITIAFHYIFPPLSIGLSLFLVLVEAVYLRTRNPLYRQLARFWVRIFGLTFALGVATGVVMEFEFGTNWAHYSRFVGDIFGSVLAAEGIFAFFLESGFLALLLFGWDKVGPRLHFFSTLMVCLGAHFSAVWIVVAGSWMQTPAGYHLVTEAGRTRAEITDYWAMIFNPSAMIRLQHTLLGAWQAGAFLVISVSAWYLLRRRHQTFALASMRLALALALVASLLTLVSGHDSAKVVADHQPAKLAAMEGHFAENTPADMYLAGWVDQASGRTRGIRLPIPGMLGLLTYGDANRPIQGLNAFAPGDRPPVQIVFQAFHLMVIIGMSLIALSLVGILYAWRGRLAETRWLLWLLIFSVLGPQLANQLGWIVAEVGRQPWIVYGLMRTSAGVSEVVRAPHIVASLALFGALYLLLFALFIFLLDRKIKHGPLDEDLTPAGHRA
jgi:cytochrome d ubiquinol oxidase subunit I